MTDQQTEKYLNILERIAKSLETLAARPNTATTISSLEVVPDTLDNVNTELETESIKSTEPIEVAENNQEAEIDYTIDDIRQAFQSYFKMNGRTASAEMLQKYNCNSVAELSENDYAAFMTDINTEVP